MGRALGAGDRCGEGGGRMGGSVEEIGALRLIADRAEHQRGGVDRHGDGAGAGRLVIGDVGGPGRQAAADLGAHLLHDEAQRALRHLPVAGSAGGRSRGGGRRGRDDLGGGGAFLGRRRHQQRNRDHRGPDHDGEQRCERRMIGHTRARRGAARHPRERRIAVDHHMLQRAEDMQRNRGIEHQRRKLVHALGGMGDGIRLRHEGQGLAEGPQDRRKARLRGMADPARGRHHQHRAVKRPVHQFGAEGLEPALGVQRRGAGLHQRPQDAGERGEEGRDADRLVRGIERLQRVDRLGAARQAFAVEAERERAEDQQRDEPVEGAGRRAVGGGGIGEHQSLGPLFGTGAG
ncbi:hypothetical protein SDC9_40113 [bioreactor metagenome]|uniref:Uncharacterized protein n=1 Tax=bioreactor metagenome TaxID=1076179 RepID=A0A644VRF6_9ZZZZ